MKILVCISHVPDTTSKINFTEGDTKFDTNGVQFVINPNDEFGLTRAMWFKEKQGASVDVVNVGGAETEPTLRKALAIGADTAIRVNTPATDGYQVAKELAKVVKDGGYDLVIAGRESIDYNGGMVPGMLAGILDARLSGQPWLTGNEPTIADIAVGSPMHLHSYQKLPLSEHGTVVAWYQRLEGLPCWSSTDVAPLLGLT